VPLGDGGVCLLPDSDSPDTAVRTSLPLNSIPTPRTGYAFSLNQEDDLDVYNGMDLKISVSEVQSTDDAACDSAAVLAAALHPNSGSWGSGLNPLRRPEVLCRDIFDLISSQIKFITADGYRSTIENLARSSLSAASSKNSSQVPPKTTGKDTMRSSQWRNEVEPREIRHELWGFPSDRYLADSRAAAEERFNRGRSMSPANRRAPRAQFRQSQSSAPGSKRGSSPESSSPAPSATGGEPAGDSAGIAGDRRSRSSSSGPRRSTRGTLLPNSKLPPKAVQRASSSVLQSSKTGPPPSSPRGQDSEEPRDPFETLKCFPAEIQGQLGNLRGPIHGVWLTEHPLSTFPYAYYDVLNFVESFSSSQLSEAKKAEWLGDLLR
jgi:hypothetical protein